ncbi:MAG TPA: FAD-binding oxidoreductase [Actinomycetales bacterium]|nr:FAD-binding oxidoreductase [Actinomycetales bacterium]
MTSTAYRKQSLTGWGRSGRSRSRVTSPGDDETWAALFAHPGARGVTLRGLGRSYGDAALNSGGVVASTGAQSTAHLDVTTGELVADGGASIATILRTTVPMGWTLPVLPGTAHVTLGGAVAADVHGKNHVGAGSFSTAVRDVVLVSPGQGPRTVSREQDPDAFWATVGGLGMTGLVRRVRLQLEPISSSRLLERSVAYPDLDSVLAAVSEADAVQHVVAWLDGHAGGASNGRGVVSVARHLAADELPQKLAREPLRYSRRPGLPSMTPGLIDMVRPGLVRLYNERKLTAANRRNDPRIGSFAQVFHPLDAVRDWPRWYGPSGFIQYQFAVPPGQEQLLGRSLELLRGAGVAPALVVLKRLGAANPAPLAFPGPGWTLALDLPGRALDVLRPVLDLLDGEVAAAGGRVYLVKDSRLRRDVVPAMYPDRGRWLQVRQRLDPEGVLTSDLARRLGLDGRSSGSRRRTAVGSTRSTVPTTASGRGTQTTDGGRGRASASATASATAPGVVANGAGGRPAVMAEVTNPGRTTRTRTPLWVRRSPSPRKNASSPAFVEP